MNAVKHAAGLGDLGDTRLAPLGFNTDRELAAFDKGVLTAFRRLEHQAEVATASIHTWIHVLGSGTTSQASMAMVQ